MTWHEDRHKGDGHLHLFPHFGGFTLIEEILNAATHGIGAILSMIGFFLLITTAALSGKDWAILSASLFGCSLVLLYMSSALYHAVPHKKLKRMLHTIDHCAIFCLIAGSYSPLALLVLGGKLGWSVFILTWSLAAIGIYLRLMKPRIFVRVSLMLYITMGWTGILFAVPVSHALPIDAIWLVLGGGFAYTGGVLFYLWRRLPYHHAIWHVMVMIGSGLHFLAIYRHILAPLESTLLS